jgi:hypothetical protein
MTLYQKLEQAKQWLLDLQKRLMPQSKQELEQMVRRVCQEEGMNYAQTNLIVAVIWAESGMNPRAINRKNKNGSIDYGLCQFNDGPPNDPKRDYSIGPGKKFSTPEEVLNNPEKCVRVMCWRVKQKNGIKDWAAFNNGSYIKYLKA